MRKEESRPAANRAARTSGWATAVNTHDTRAVVVDPTTIRVLSTVVPCPLCADGLCWRCWRVAAVAVELTIAARVEQCVDDAWGVAA